MLDTEITIIWSRMLIISEYPNNKNDFIQFTSITDLFTNYKCMGLCPTSKKEKSESSPVLRKQY